MRQRVGVGRVLVAIAGVLAVMGYAGLMALQALVLDPLAAVPGETLAQIHVHLEAQAFNVTGDIRSVLGSAVIGVTLAVVVAVWSILRRLNAAVASALFLGVLAFGAPVTFGTGFALGMDVADAYGIGGASHTIWAGVLYITSLTALVAIPLVFAGAWTQRNGRRARSVHV
jgi:hypothetical protein